MAFKIIPAPENVTWGDSAMDAFVSFLAWPAKSLWASHSATSIPMIGGLLIAGIACIYFSRNFDKTGESSSRIARNVIASGMVFWVVWMGISVCMSALWVGGH